MNDGNDETESIVRSILVDRAGRSSEARAGDIIAAAIAVGPSEMSRRSRARAAVLSLGSLVAASALAFTVLQGLSRDEDSQSTPVAGTQPSTTSTRTSEDCVAGLKFDGVVYTMAMGKSVEVFPVSRSIGRATLEPCSDGLGGSSGGRGDSGGPRELDVFEVSNVPTTQAILVGGANHEGTLYLSVEAPQSMDPDLAGLLAQFKVAHG